MGKLVLRQKSCNYSIMHRNTGMYVNTELKQHAGVEADLLRHSTL